MLDGRIDALTFRPDPAASPCALVRTPVPRPPGPWDRMVLRLASAMGHTPNVHGLGFATVLALAMWVVGFSAVSPWIFAVGVTYYAGAVAATSVRDARSERALGVLAQPLAPEVDPVEVTSVEMRLAYEHILRLHEDIRMSLVGARGVQTTLRSVFTECIAVVQAAGRLARLSNPLQRYLELHGSSHIKLELQRLSANADVAADPIVQGVYQHAAAARGRQLGTLLEIQHLRDRIRARLELIHASLASVAALVIKLQALDLEQAELAGASMSEQLASLTEELSILETTIEDGI